MKGVSYKRPDLIGFHLHKVSKVDKLNQCLPRAETRNLGVRGWWLMGDANGLKLIMIRVAQL